jgi:hypothetical protein
VQYISAPSRLAPETLAEEVGDVRLIIDHEDANTHPSLQGAAVY